MTAYPATCGCFMCEWKESASRLQGSYLEMLTDGLHYEIYPAYTCFKNANDSTFMSMIND